MPSIINKYRIFIASPSDLTEEREAIDDVVSELNLNSNNTIIEVLKWETNSAPGISNDGVQALINSDIPEYDLFVGLLWLKFGTPTKLYGSGTEEEFELAHSKYIKNPNSIQILFYFKNALPLSIDDIDPEQFSKVKKFKASLGDKNVLYWNFDNKEYLCRYLRTHIPARIESLRNSSNLPIVKIEEVTPVYEVEIIDEEELGIIDFLEVVEDSFATSTHSLIIMSDATSWIAKEIVKKSNEINKLIAKNHGQPISIKVQRNIFDRTSIVLNDFAKRIEPEIPIYFMHFEKAIDALSKLVNIYKVDFDDKNEEINDIQNQLKGLIDIIPGTIENHKAFLNSIESWPRMSKELNSARSNVTEKLSDLLQRLEISHSIALEVYKTI